MDSLDTSETLSRVWYEGLLSKLLILVHLARIVDFMFLQQADHFRLSRLDSVSIASYGCWRSLRFHTRAHPFSIFR